MFWMTFKCTVANLMQQLVVRTTTTWLAMDSLTAGELR